LKVPGIDRAALVLAQQTGDGVRLCHLLNAFTYLIDSAFIIVDDSSGYRLLVKSYGQVVMDQQCRSLREAKQNFRILLTELVGRGTGFYFRNVTEMVLFGVRGRLRTLDPGRRQENIILCRKNRHSQKPEALYHIIEQCSSGPYLELFARQPRPHWHQWGNQLPKTQ
jgi:hypothetical protein